MQIGKILTFVFVSAFAHSLHAAEYPLSGVWADTNSPSKGTEACASYLKKPKKPLGHLVVFNGAKKTEFNGGYLEEETVENLSVQKLGEGEFRIVDRYYDDGDGGGKPGFKRRTYRLRLFPPDKIDIKEGNYPSTQYVRCFSPVPKTPARLSKPALQSQTTPTLVEPDREFYRVGDWQIFTARWGTGCIAEYKYDDLHAVSVGGLTPDKMSLIVVADRKSFQNGLDDNGDGYAQIELVLDDRRIGSLRPYGYRGIPGIVASIDRDLKQALVNAPTLKLTENGSLKFRMPLVQIREAMAQLDECFKKTR